MTRYTSRKQNNGNQSLRGGGESMPTSSMAKEILEVYGHMPKGSYLKRIMDTKRKYRIVALRYPKAHEVNKIVRSAPTPAVKQQNRNYRPYKSASSMRHRRLSQKEKKEFIKAISHKALTTIKKISARHSDNKKMGKIDLEKKLAKQIAEEAAAIVNGRNK